ncbi:hypothetical protein KJ865_05780, partial [Myxococcota bacterium]|nr:hypothetical protein [Myxococcota bacterium]
PFLRIRIGRFLAPMGLINTDHEPTKFNGVERPLVARYIIPTTWSPDGVEVSGGLKGWFNYTFGVVSSLDGSAFSATNGIRDGRVKERPGFASSPTLVGRFEATPFPGLQKDGQLLRIGGSVFHGPVDAGNKGIPNSIESDFTMFTADLVFSIAGVEMKGVLAYTLLTDSATLNPEVAKNMLGYYVEAAYSLPRTLTRPVKAERIILFGRFERFDTQFRMFDGTMADPGGDRSAITAGLGWYLEKDAVLKLDYTRLETVDAGKVDHLFSAGVGFRF